jgi:hypothetical protein
MARKQTKKTNPLQQGRQSVLFLMDRTVVSMNKMADGAILFLYSQILYCDAKQIANVCFFPLVGYCIIKKDEPYHLFRAMKVRCKDSTYIFL